MAVMPITDSLFLFSESREKPLHVGGLQLFEPPPGAGPEFVGELYRQALGHTDIDPALRRRVVRPVTSLGAWSWREDDDIDLEYHVRHSALPRPGRVRELLALVSRLHSALLDRSRPLWNVHLIEGLADGRFALYTKMHHALVDGVSAIRMLDEGLSADPGARDMSPPWGRRDDGARDGGDRDGGDRDGGSTTAWNPLRFASGAARTAWQAARAVTGASDAAMRSVVRAVSDQATVLPFQAPRTMLNVPITGSRRFAADSWAFERLRAVADASDRTLNDVVLAMCAGALRRYLSDQDALPDDPLIAMVPVSLRSDGDTGAGNAVGVVLCNLGTHLADPQARFDLVHSSMQRAKKRLRGLNQPGVLLLSAASFAPLGLGPLFRFEPLRRPPFNLVISNVPGPREPRYWNGARLTGMYPVSIPYDGQALNVTVLSYAGSFEIGLTGCQRSVPGLQRLLDHLETSLTELEKLAAA